MIVEFYTKYIHSLSSLFVLFNNVFPAIGDVPESFIVALHSGQILDMLYQRAKLNGTSGFKVSSE